MSSDVFRRFLHCVYFSLHKNLQRCISSVKYVAELQAGIEEQIKSHEMKPKKQPGTRRIGYVPLPEQLIKAVEKLTPDFNSQMFDQAKRLNNQLSSRRPAIEREEYITRAELLLAKKFRGNPEEFTQKQIEAVGMKVKNKLKQEVGRWKPVEYDEHNSKVYLLARLAPNFAVISWVFSEIKHSVPSFVPKTFLDFGSGVGSAIWAAQNTWGTEFKEFFCVDASCDMNDLAECLLKGTCTEEDSPDALSKTLYFRQFLPTSNKLKYDLVVSAFSMMELPSLKERLRVIDILWQKTTDTLVVIENGSFAGYCMVMDARDYILHVENIKAGATCEKGAYIVAPCPHDMPCPKLKGEKLVPCNFEAQYKPLFPSQGHTIKKEGFSFVVLRKKQRQMDTEYWPRVLKTNKLKRHVRCHLCCSDGELHEVIFTKAKNTREAYRCARVSSTGDLLPVSLSTVLTESEESEEGLQDDFEFSNNKPYT